MIRPDLLHAERHAVLSHELGILRLAARPLVRLVAKLCVDVLLWRRCTGTQLGTGPLVIVRLSKLHFYFSF